LLDDYVAHASNDILPPFIPIGQLGASAAYDSRFNIYIYIELAVALCTVSHKITFAGDWPPRLGLFGLM